MPPGQRRPVLILAVLAILAAVAYLPALRQQLLEDDYPNLALSLHYGAPSAWHDLATSVFRLRATSCWLMCAMFHLFGVRAVPYYCLSILLHIINTWLVYALGAWRPIGYELAAWAAGFFAVYEGHQEAVMWFSACNELMMFLFGTAALICWIRFLRGHGWRWYAASLLSFSVSLISKESAVIFVVLFLPPLFFEGRARRAVYLLPLLLLAGASIFLTYQSRTWSFRFEDGSFSLHAPFWLTLPKNLLRMLWFWGLLALPFAWKNRRVLVIALGWMVVGLIPYSFLTYSTQIPSRQTYLASLGLSLLVAQALRLLHGETPRWRMVTAAVCVLILVTNIGYLWTKKRRQFMERAEPTQELIALAQKTQGPIYVRCFPRPRIIATEAVHLATAKPPADVIWNQTEAQRRRAKAMFCYHCAAAGTPICATN